jgi:hypothetical protein
MGRFIVIEYHSFFAIRDTRTGNERLLGDGVDSLFDADGNGISPGTPGFCQAWADALNADECETFEAYFTEPVDQEKRS